MGRQPIHLAAQVGCESSVQFLIDQQGVDVNIQSSRSGVTPLHVAAKVISHHMTPVLM